MLDAVRRPAAGFAWPMTEAAKDALDAEIRSLEAELAAGTRVHASGVHDPGPGLVRLDRARATRRLEQLQALAEDIRVEADADAAIIGRRVTIVDDERLEATYALVLPGEGDPSRGWLSVDSPVGLAVLGRRAGDEALVRAPGGDWPITVVGVE
jgi:hypothetical protein